MTPNQEEEFDAHSKRLLHEQNMIADLLGVCHCGHGKQVRSFSPALIARLAEGVAGDAQAVESFVTGNNSS